MENKCVLYLEDEIELANEVIAELKEYGIKVVHCLSATDGITKAANQKFDLCIADINLKHGTGDQVIKAIKTNSKHMNFKTPILVVSSHITSELVYSIGKDIQYALVKPFDLDKLIENVFSLLKICPPDRKSPGASDSE